MYWMRGTLLISTLIIIIQSFQITEVIASNSTSLLINQTNEENGTDSRLVIILKQVDYNLWKFVPPILYIVGAIGNMLTIAVLRR